MAKPFKDDNPLESFLTEFAANITSREKMPICTFAKQVLFNGSDKFSLYPTQRAILKSFYNEPLDPEELAILKSWQLENRTTWVQDRSYIALVLEAGRRASKALSLNTVLETPNGTKLFKDIKPGDYVFNPNGTPIKVLNETPVFYNHKIYRLHFSDGSTIDCDEGHLWKTWDKSARKAYGRAKNPIKHPKVITTKDIVNTLTVKRKDGKLENNHSIELAKPLQYKKQKQLIHPYVLGLWCGDGDKTKGMITSSKKDLPIILKKLEKLGYSPKVTPTKDYKYRLTSDKLTKELKELSLINNKHIPNNYIYCSLSQRLHLIKGLMDSDGSVCKKGKSCFVNTNFQLADSVYKIANSLGCVATQSTYQGKCNNKLTKLYKEIRFRPAFTPFYLPRKIERYKPCVAQNNKRFIVYAELIPSIPVKCITVEGGLFLVGNNIITHNCNAEFATIHTTAGILTYKELHNRLSEGERIGIQTYNFKTNSLYNTYDIKTEFNAFEEVYEITTETGKKEITNENHPYLKWYDETKVNNWVELRQLRPGNSIAVSSTLDFWGKEQPSNLDLEKYAFILSLSKRASKYKYKHNSKKEVRVLTKGLDVSINKGYLTLRENVELEDFIDVNLIKSLTKDSTIYLLKAFCRFSYELLQNRERASIHFICRNSFISLIQYLFQKLGIYTEVTNLGLKIDYDQPLQRLFDIIGWGITCDEVELRTYIGKKGFKETNPKSPEENSEKTFGTNGIHFEKIKSIKPLGKHNTIALEVKETHVIANEIVSHNSTMSSIICLKEFYDLITLDNPAETYGMIGGSPIAILVLAQSKAQVKDTIFSAIRGYAEQSMYFKSLARRGEIQILSEEIRCPEKNIAIYAKHTRTEALVGYTIKCMILDEVARFQSVGEDGRNKAFEIWKNVATGGTGFKEHFKKVAISSAWEPGDPIEVLYEEGQKDPLTLGFKLTTFQVNLDLVKGVTPSVVSDYTTDFVKARREYEGIRFNKFNSFIDKTRLEKACTSTSCLDATPIPIDIGEGDEVRKYAGIQINRLAAQESTEELSFIHIDPALKKDSAGLAIATPVAVEEGWKIRLDGFIKWEPHTDNQGFKRIVSFLNIEDILDQIIEKRNIQRVTFDQYNSESFIQSLHAKGIDSQQVSCTRDAQFSYYMLFRDLLNHDYIILPKDSTWTGDVVTELSELVLKPNKSIIHPHAAKDMADAVVNAVFQAHQYMIRSGMQMNYGMGVNVAQGSILPKITLTNTDNLKIGSARDRLYKNILK